MTKKNLFKFRNFIFKNYREEILSKTICTEIEKLEQLGKKKIIKIIDYGSGYNPIVIEKIIKNLNNKYKKTKFKAYCYDFYSKNELEELNINSNIKFYNVKDLSKKEINKFNFCLILDVLHHIGLENENKISKLIRKLKKKSKFLIIKDHFQYGFFSNLALILMDVVGNFGSNVKIPKIYFNSITFENLLSKMKLSELNRIDDINYYKWYWIYFNSKKFQFISIIK